VITLLSLFNHLLGYVIPFNDVQFALVAVFTGDLHSVC